MRLNNLEKTFEKLPLKKNSSGEPVPKTEEEVAEEVVVKEDLAKEEKGNGNISSVSYTHLTLPTKA